MAEYIDVTMTHEMDEPPSLHVSDDHGNPVQAMVVENDVNEWSVWSYTIRIQRDEIAKL